jgi:hypothetical protein
MQPPRESEELMKSTKFREYGSIKPASLGCIYLGKVNRSIA